MSQERLNDLYEILKKNNYHFLDTILNECVDKPDFNFLNSEDVMKWRIFKNDNLFFFDLFFSCSNYLGLNTNNVNDLFQCCLWYNNLYTGIDLFFDKQKSKSWESGLSEFILEVNDYVGSQEPR